MGRYKVENETGWGTCREKEGVERKEVKVGLGA